MNEKRPQKKSKIVVDLIRLLLRKLPELSRPKMLLQVEAPRMLR